MRKISLLTIMVNSIYSPKEIAKYRFLTIGKAIQYVFLFALIFTLPGIFNLLFKKQGLGGSINEVVPDAGSLGIFTVMIITMSYLLNAAILFLMITALAAIGEPVAVKLGRKLPYRQSWRLTASAITLPGLLFVMLSVLTIKNAFLPYCLIALAVLMILLAIKAIPKPKTRKQ